MLVHIVHLLHDGVKSLVDITDNLPDVDEQSLENRELRWILSRSAAFASLTSIFNSSEMVPPTCRIRFSQSPHIALYSTHNEIVDIPRKLAKVIRQLVGSALTGQDTNWR